MEFSKSGNVPFVLNNKSNSQNYLYLIKNSKEEVIFQRAMIISSDYLISGIII